MGVIKETVTEALSLRNDLFWDYEKNTMDPGNLGSGMHVSAWFLCDNGHSRFAPINSTIKRKSRCRVCLGLEIVPGVNDIWTVEPELTSRYLDTSRNIGIDTTRVSAGNPTLKLDWTCGTHYWSDSPGKMYGRYRGCKYCDGRAIYPGYNDAFTLNPEIADRLVYDPSAGVDYTKISTSSTRVLTWTCENNHIYDASVRSIVRDNSKCPFCTRRIPLKGETDLYTTHKELVDLMWDFDKNTILPNTLLSGSDNIVWWKCAKGHSWEAHVYSVTGGSRCKKCVGRVSKGEDELEEFLQGLGVTVERNNKTEIYPKEIDLYLPEFRIGIEYNGTFWHSDAYRNQHLRDMDKYTAMLEAGIRPIIIWSDTWSTRKEAVQSYLTNAVGMSNSRVYARNCSIAVVTTEESSEFLNRYHVQGSGAGSIKLGIIDPEGTLVGVGIFKRRQDDLELVRYATSINVVGGHSKLIKHVENTYDYGKLVTFVDVSMFSGTSYDKTGWVLDGLVEPDYSYVVRDIRVHKFNYRKNRFRTDSKLQYSAEMTERELAKLNGLPRSYDYGKMRYVKYKTDDR